MVKYPEAQIRLVGEDGNAFSIIGRATQALRRAGVSREVISQYQAEATSGDYSHLLVTTMRWVSCDNDEEEENPYACPDCDEKYAVGGCPACGGEGV